jgi:hypothetical protein
MMLFGVRAAASKKRPGRLRPGALLALLALLIQTAIPLLPMQAMAKSSLPLDGPSICHSGDLTQQTATKPGKPSGHTTPECPVCQAFHLLGTMALPTPTALPQASIQAVAAASITSVVIRPHYAAAAHQARAPPPSV